MTDRVTGVRLPRTYDPELLARDLGALRSLPQVPQPGPYHDGDWTGLTLYSPGGDRPGLTDPVLHPYAPTPALDRAPYLAGLLAELPAPKLLTRLLTLPPESDIGEHSDAGSTFQFGSLRLHVPIVTHEQVVMVVGGDRMRWRPGELWWGDFSRPHWLRNDSDVTRVHLVVDVEVTDQILALFPADVVAAQEATGAGISRHRPPLPADRRTDAELAPFAASFTVPTPLMPLFAQEGDLRGLAREAVATTRPDAGRLVVSLDGRPAFALVRTGERVFSVVGLPPGVYVEFDDATAPSAAEVVVRGVPEDLYAAQLGVQNGPVIPEQRFLLPLRQPVS
ncbi:MAG TPA: aspartyl/asparaginyl beta-hydroxylase domain-containing protein [Mycobacteriales bacterium]|nr:aspartyl/asparaginyl beta-hydroxylase domain-containing protein [Mycobacteriales bacterium]